MYGREARALEVGGRGGALAAGVPRRLREEGGAGSAGASLACTLHAPDGRTLGSLTVEVGALDGYAGEERATLLRQGAAMLAGAIQASAPGELAVRAALVADGTVLEEREFRLPANGTQVIPSPRLPLSELVASYERRLIEDVLRTTGGNRARAARILQTTERILGYRIQQYAIDCAQYRRGRGG